MPHLHQTLSNCTSEESQGHSHAGSSLFASLQSSNPADTLKRAVCTAEPGSAPIPRTSRTGMLNHRGNVRSFFGNGGIVTPTVTPTAAPTHYFFWWQPDNITYPQSTGTPQHSCSYETHPEQSETRLYSVRSKVVYVRAGTSVEPWSAFVHPVNNPVNPGLGYDM